MSWYKDSAWDEPVDGDGSTADAEKKRKLSWWDQFNDTADRDTPPLDADTAGYSSTDAYSYRDTFDDSDKRWYRKSKFSYGKYKDYSPSRLFRSAFRSIGFGSYTSYGSETTSAENELKNKAIRALRVLTRNANTVANKAARITYAIKFSSGVDVNQTPGADFGRKRAKGSKQREQTIYVSPDELAKTTDHDAADAVTDALTGFVLLRVQLEQTVPHKVLQEFTASGTPDLANRIIEVEADKTLTTATAAEKAALIADDYSAGIIAKNLLTRIVRRSVVQDWGGFAPYFVRHAKKFAAMREKLAKEGATITVEHVALQIAYNMLADDEQITLDPEVDRIVEKHLGAKLEFDEILPACRALMAALRAYLHSKTEESELPSGELEETLKEVFQELADGNEAAQNVEKADAQMREKLDELASLFDETNELRERHQPTSAAAPLIEKRDELATAASAIARLNQLNESLDLAVPHAKQISELDKCFWEDGRAGSMLGNYVNLLRRARNNVMIHNSARELLDKHKINESALFPPALPPAPEEAAATAGEYANNLAELAEKTKAAIQAEIAELKTKLVDWRKEAADYYGNVSAELKQLHATVQEFAKKAAAEAAQHENGGLLHKMAERLAENIEATEKQFTTGAAAALKLDTFKRVRSMTGISRLTTGLSSLDNLGAAALCQRMNAMMHPIDMSPAAAQFAQSAESAYSRQHDAAVRSNSSVARIDDKWHKPAIDRFMSQKKPAAMDFKTSLKAAMHRELLEKLIKMLTRGEKHDMPADASSSDMPDGAKEALNRLAAALSMTPDDLLDLLHEMQKADRQGTGNAKATRIAEKVKMQLKELAQDAPVDSELFGSDVANSTKLCGDAVNSVNEEAQNKAEEDFVAFLSHNSARPVVTVRKRKGTKSPTLAATVSAVIKRNRAAIDNIKNALRFQSDKREGEVHGLLSGDLDEGSLHKLPYDSEHIWSQKTIARLPDVAVGILVDQSGSMSCNDKIKHAREMCIVLAAAAKQIPGVHLHIYGHTANQHGDSDLTLFEHYSSHGDARSADLSSLGGISSHSNNYDGYAIKETAKRLSQDPAKKKYLFIIADGQPAGSGYNGHEAEKHVTSVCSYVRHKLDIATYAFAVGVPASSQKCFERQYGANNVVFISNVREALPRIVRFLRNTLQKEKTLVDANCD